jgi:hypothetical protein
MVAVPIGEVLKRLHLLLKDIGLVNFGIRQSGLNAHIRPTTLTLRYGNDLPENGPLRGNNGFS